MSSQLQSKYIADLVVLKTKEFKEVKEMLLASDIVGDNPSIVKNAETIAQITDALTDLQASKFIDLLLASKEPQRDIAYSSRRIEKATEALDDIKKTIAEWDFN